ncbi:hypothetical protein LCGC14_3085790, partial [marine sediment metagenome]
WTDLLYSLVPNGSHRQAPASMPAFDGSDTTSPLGVPKETMLFALYASGQFGSTFPPYMDEAYNCLNATDPFETNPLCTNTISTTMPSFINDRSAYYQSNFFANIATDPDYRMPIFNAGTFTDPLFTAVESLRMANRLRSVVPDYPIQQYFGDYEHFVQNKAKEWGDICGADHHVCEFADYPGGDLNAEPTDLIRTGVTTRLSRFIDHYAQPPGNPSEPQPAFDTTASLQVCPQNASAYWPADEPGQTFSASQFDALSDGELQIDMTGTQTPTSQVDPNGHADKADPLQGGGLCPTISDAAGSGVATYESDPLTDHTIMVGGPIVSIDYTADAADLQLNTRLYDVFPGG